MATLYNTSHIKTQRKLPLGQRLGVYNPEREATKMLALSPLQPLTPLGPTKGVQEMDDSQTLASIDSQIKRSPSRGSGNHEPKFSDDDDDRTLDSFFDTGSLSSSWDYLSTSSRTLLSREQPRVQQVSGSQFKSNLKTVIKCKFCDGFKFSLKKVKDVNRRLRIKIKQFQENEKYQSDSKKITEFLFAQTGQASGGKDADALRRRVDELSRAASDSKYQSDSLLKQLTEQRSKYEQITLKGQIEVKSLKERLDRATEELNLAYKSKDMLYKEKSSLEETVEKLRELLNAASNVDTTGLKEVENLRQQVHTLGAEKIELQEEVKKLKNSISRQGNQVIQDKAEVQRLRAALQSALGDTEMKTRELMDSETARQEMSQKLKQERITVKNMTKANKDIGFQLQDTKAENGHLNEEVEKLRAKLSALDNEMAKERESSLKNLEKAISQSIKLVVVAPTVNVNVADERVDVKSAISKDELRTFMDGLLAEYSMLYKQEESDMAPDNKTPLNQWLTSILGKMQESIEQHVKAATADAEEKS